MKRNETNGMEYLVSFTRNQFIFSLEHFENLFFSVYVYVRTKLSTVPVIRAHFKPYVCCAVLCCAEFCRMFERRSLGERVLAFQQNIFVEHLLYLFSFYFQPSGHVNGSTRIRFTYHFMAQFVKYIYTHFRIL